MTTPRLSPTPPTPTLNPQTPPWSDSNRARRTASHGPEGALRRAPTSLPLFPQEDSTTGHFAAGAAGESAPVEGPKVDLLQLALSRLIAQPDCARRMLALEDAVPRAARMRYRTLMHGLWARRLTAGARADVASVQEALDTAWAEPATQQRWQAFVQSLGLQACARLARRSLAVPAAGATQLPISDRRLT